MTIADIIARLEAGEDVNVMAWNAMRQGRRLGLLRWRGEQNPNQPFPRVK